MTTPPPRASRKRRFVWKAGRIAALAVAIGIWVLGTTSAKTGSGYVETDLVMDTPGLTDGNGVLHNAPVIDPHLVNPWGVAESSTSPFWVSDNGASVSTLYNTQGQPQPLVVSIPAPGEDPRSASGAPTGIVFNIGATAGAFKISGFTAGVMPVAVTAPAVFLFATEDGTILGWNPGVNPPGTPAAEAGRHAIIAVDHSQAAAVYKGLAIAQNASGAFLLYATNFRSGKVEAFGDQFQAAPLPQDAFTDPHLPRDYSPFNIVPLSIGGSQKLFVTYAVRNSEGKDDVAGEGHGIVDTFDLAGNMLDRFAQHGQLNSPWGVTLAPGSFGEFGGDVLIGNFGDGRINAFDPASGRFINKVRDPDGKAIRIEGLWTIMFGNGHSGGDAKTLYFTAGTNGESDGLFGSLSPAEED